MSGPSLPAGRTRERPIGYRSCARRGIAVTIAISSIIASTPASADPLVLDREHVVALARSASPAVRLAEARVGESRALFVGARSLAITNPELAVTGGPRLLSGASNTVIPDVTVSLVWPLDVSGARSGRYSYADALTQAAMAEVDDARRTAVGEALDLWVRGLGDLEMADIHAAREALDDALFNAVRVRRTEGATGDGELALGLIARAQSQSQRRGAEGQRAARVEELKAHLGLDAATQVRLAGPLPISEPAPLDALLASLGQRPDVVLATARIEAGRRDVGLQRSLAVVVPRLMLIGGRENEYFVRGGIEVPLPVYQRNQTPIALSTARLATRSAERQAALQRSIGELRAAYARYLGSRAAYLALEESIPAIADAEHLSVRAYELGQSDLTVALVARRELIAARTMHLDARVALARARVAVDVAAGVSS